MSDGSSPGERWAHHSSRSEIFASEKRESRREKASLVCGATLLTKASAARGEAAARRSGLNARHNMPPKAAASNDLGMVKALTDRLEELDATAAEFQVMVYEGGEELRGAARNAPLRPLALCQMRALGRGDELRNPFTGSGRGYEELQGRWVPRSAVR